MKNITLIFILFSTVSCRDEFGANTVTTIINNSGHEIELQPFFNGKVQTSIAIVHNGEKEYVQQGTLGNSGSIVPPFILIADSIWVIYFNKVSIWHTRESNSPVSKSLLIKSSYTSDQVDEGLNEFTYTFTPADYEEALEFGD